MTYFLKYIIGISLSLSTATLEASIRVSILIEDCDIVGSNPVTVNIRFELRWKELN